MAKKKETKEVKKKVKKVPPYKLEITVNGETFKANTETIKEALELFVASPVKPFSAKTTLVLKYSKGKTERQRNYFAHEANRFINRIAEIPSELEFTATKITQELNG